MAALGHGGKAPLERKQQTQNERGRNGRVSPERHRQINPRYVFHESWAFSLYAYVLSLYEHT